MEFKTRVKNENDMEVWEMSEAYDVNMINIKLPMINVLLLMFHTFICISKINIAILHFTHIINLQLFFMYVCSSNTNFFIRKLIF